MTGGGRSSGRGRHAGSGAQARRLTGCGGQHSSNTSPAPGGVQLEEFLGDWAARTVIVPGNHDARWEEPDIDDRLSAWRGFARDCLKRKVVGLPDHPFAQVAAAVVAAGELASLAGRLETTPAALALAFPLTNPAVTSALFGATSSEQVRANCAAIACWTVSAGPTSATYGTSGGLNTAYPRQIPRRRQRPAGTCRADATAEFW